MQLTENIAVGVASSGIAATLISDGGNCTFNLQVTFERMSCGQFFICAIRKNEPLGQFLHATKLIVWDECTMNHQAHIKALDRSL